MEPDVTTDRRPDPVFSRGRQRGAVTTRVAGGLLVVMGAAAAGTTWLEAHGGYAGWGLSLLRAGSRAGLIGGLADWFAVSALFRRPLGLPIPHTAIIPRQKARLGEALGRFVSGQLFTDEEVRRALARIDVAEVIAETLDRPATRQALVSTLRAGVPDLFERMEDGRASAAFARALPVLLNGEELAPLVTRALRAMIDSEMHQEVLSFLLAKTQETVTAREADFRRFVEDRVREQGGRLLGWAIGASVASRVLAALRAELERIDPMDSEIRHGFTKWVRGELDRMEDDPVRRSEMAGAISSVLTHGSLKAWSGELWDRLRLMTEQDAAREDGWSASVLDAAISGLVSSMRENATMRARIGQTVEKTVIRLLPGLRDKITRYIAGVMAGWEGDEIAAKLEARVGRDLAYIRINGTLVGFLAGAALDAAERLFLGP